MVSFGILVVNRFKSVVLTDSSALTLSRNQPEKLTVHKFTTTSQCSTRPSHSCFAAARIGPSTVQLAALLQEDPAASPDFAARRVRLVQHLLLLLACLLAQQAGLALGARGLAGGR